MSNTKRFKKALMYGLPVLAASAIAAGVAIPLVTQHAKETNMVNKVSELSKTSFAINQSPQRQYLNQNEVSVMMVLQQNNQFIQQFLTRLIQQNPQLINFFRTVSTPPAIYNVETGTGWMLDYSVDPQEQNMVNYYLATNIHVVSLTYKMVFKNAYGEQLTIRVPANQETTNGMAMFISQPQGHQNENDDTNLDSLTSSMNYWGSGWYQLGSYEIIDLGSVFDTNKEVVQADFEFQSGFNKVEGVVNNDYQIVTKGDVYQNLISKDQNQQADDMAVIKTSIPANTPIMPKYFENLQDLGIENGRQVYINDENNVKLKQEYININKMFSTKQDLKDVNTDSTYITKLRYLNQQIADKKITKDELLKLFPFAKFDNLKSLAVGGFPGFSENNQSGVRFSVGNVAKDEISDQKVTRPFIIYNENGKLKYSLFDTKNNRFLDLQQLTPGSSGSMAINQNNQIVGILWGGAGSQYNIVTPVFNNPKSNLIYDFIKYQNTHDKNSQLLKLFTGLYNYKTTDNDKEKDKTVTQESQSPSQDYILTMYINYTSGDFYYNLYM